MNNEEIIRDLPLLHAKIAQCNRAILDFEKNIGIESISITDLTSYIILDEEAAKAGRRTRFDINAMTENKKRHVSNIELFREKIVNEKEKIKKFEGVIAVLTTDLEKKPPVHIVLEQREPRG